MGLGFRGFTLLGSFLLGNPIIWRSILGVPPLRKPPPPPHLGLEKFKGFKGWRVGLGFKGFSLGKVSNFERFRV